MCEQSVSELITQWLQGKPAWYTYALHIALKGDYSSEDVDALAKAACESHGIDLGIQSDAILQPYCSDDLAGVGLSERNVVLESITAKKNVNALLPESALSFSSDGLTIVYGNNGSGKSGFSRIIRNASTSRSGVGTILPNVFGNDDDIAVSITATVDGATETLSWENNGERPYPRFPEISFFDAVCATKELNSKDNAILYTPKIVEAFTQFAQLVSSVGVKIKQIEDEIKPIIYQSSIPSGLSELPLIQSVFGCENSDAAEHIINEAMLQDKDINRMSALPKLIESDPSIEVPKLSRKLFQLNHTHDLIVLFLNCCSVDFVQKYAKAEKELEDAESAARAARELFKENANLDGIGGDEWRALWEAARQYSDKIVYPDAKYPYVANDALCPLCQQPLNEDAARRMRTFEDYVSGSVEKNLDEKRATFSSLTKVFLDTAASITGDNAVLGILESPEAVQRMESLIKQVTNVTGVPDEMALRKLSSTARDVDRLILFEIDTMKSSLEAIQNSMQPGEIERMKAELLSLKGREWIVNNSSGIIADTESRATKRALEIVYNECGTRSISSLVSTISKIEIVERMKEHFTNELAKLYASSQRVLMTTYVRSGQECQRMDLEGASEKAANVLSEGEQKIVALAGFFALLDVMSSESTVVLDDPVTSLDHKWREVVARRIVEEAHRRPVVVFTHEPLFCVRLSSLADEAKVQYTYRTVYKRGSDAGIVSNELDWNASTAKKRIGILRNMVVDIRRKIKTNGYYSDSDRDNDIISCYSKLRAAWERAVEEVLLNEVVQRSQPQIQTKRLRFLSDIENKDIDDVNNAMTKCSKITDAHDNPLAAPNMLPDTDELEQDINILDSWINRIRGRRK